MPKLILIDNEIERLGSLPQNEFGAIADTYDTLHGIVFINEISAAYLTSDDGSPDVSRTLAFCSDLISLNLFKLIRRMRMRFRTTSPDLQPLSGPALWVKYLLQFSSEIGHVMLVNNFANCSYDKSPNIVVSDLLGEYRTLCEDVDAYFDVQTISDRIGNGYTSDDTAVFLHSLKLISSALRFHVSYRGKCEQFDDAYFYYIGNCVDSMSASFDTYLDQFRLLHQIPEALSIPTLSLMTSIGRDLDSGNLVQALDNLTVANSIMDVILASLSPLIELMFPAEYYKFRKNLGGTSGSQSRGLGAKLLGSAYFTMCDAFIRQRKGLDDTKVGNSLAIAFKAFRHRIYRWRDQHLLLPRNVLGSGTTSLMGSKNAPDAAVRMSRSFERKDPLASIPDFAEHRSDWPELYEVEKKLLLVTGELTREKFKEVERR